MQSVTHQEHQPRKETARTFSSALPTTESGRGQNEDLAAALADLRMPVMAAAYSASTATLEPSTARIETQRIPRHVHASRLHGRAGKINTKALTTLGGVLFGGLAIPSMLKLLNVGFAESAAWGLNVETGIFLGTVLLTSMSAWGGFQQVKTIWSRNSAKAVPLGMNSLFAGVSLAFLVNGIQSESLAMIINGAGLGAFSIATAAAIMKRTPGMSLFKKAASIATITALPAIMAIIPQKDLFLTSLLLSSALSRIEQPLVMLRERTAGSVEPRALITSMIACTVWGFYGFFQHKIPLMINNPIIFASMAASMALWCKFRPVKGDGAGA